MRYWDRNEYVYDQISKEYLEILDSYQYDLTASKYDKRIVKNHPINSIAVLVMTIHELITHLDDPGYLGFNFIQPNHEVAAVHKANLRKIFEGIFKIHRYSFLIGSISRIVEILSKGDKEGLLFLKLNQLFISYTILFC